MSDNFQQFSAIIGDFAEKDIPDKVQQATQKIGLQALRGVINKTPVDTGRARGNWQASIGAPESTVVGATDPSGEAPLPDNATTDTFWREASVIQGALPFARIYISNNLPYIRRLEDGSSTQAPTGMVSTTVTEIESQFRRIK